MISDVLVYSVVGSNQPLLDVSNRAIGKRDSRPRTSVQLRPYSGSRRKYPWDGIPGPT
jgi:hypothetical protein